jgi:hypothetical protein
MGRNIKFTGDMLSTHIKSLPGFRQITPFSFNSPCALSLINSGENQK